VAALASMARAVIVKNISELHLNALRYVRNAGGSPEVEWFDDDHDPIGPDLRRDLLEDKLITIQQDRFINADVIVLTVEGEKILIAADQSRSALP